MPAKQTAFPFTFGTRLLDLSVPRVMGIVNMTPDSFSDGGDLFRGVQPDLEKALARARAMHEAGADIIDVGGESTRPGAEEISSQEEIDRVMPLLDILCRELDSVISVDTSNPELMTLAAKAGAGLINDVRALQCPGALEKAAVTGLPICLMHMQGNPENMQEDPNYRNIVREIMSFLQARVDACTDAGIERNRLLLDPGFGFGKTQQHNLEILSRLDRLLALELPVLVGISRKTVIGKLTGREPKDRMAGSLAAAVIAVMKGACIIRTHDVAETVDALKICSALKASE